MEKEYKIFLLKTNEYIENLSKWDVVSAILALCSDYANSEWDIPAYKSKVNRGILKQISFGEYDTTFVSYEDRYFYSEEKGHYTIPIKFNNRKKLRIYDNFDRIISPFQLNIWLSTFNKELYNSLLSERNKTYTKYDIPAYTGSKEKFKWRTKTMK